MLQFLKSLYTSLRFYLVSAGVVFCLGLFGLIANSILLPGYTHNQEALTVPDVTKRALGEAQLLLEQRNLRFSILEKRYNAAFPGEYVLDQNPKGGQLVKPNRRIYLTVNTSETPKVNVPNVENLSLRNARLQIENYGLEVGNISYASSKFKNVVIDQSIPSGTKVERGTLVSLIVSDGLGETRVATPSLVGLRLSEAQFRLRDRGLRIGSVQFTPDTTEANTVLDFSVDDNTAIYASAKPDTVIEGTTFNLVISEPLRTQEAVERGVVLVDSTQSIPPDSTNNR